MRYHLTLAIALATVSCAGPQTPNYTKKVSVDSKAQSGSKNSNGNAPLTSNATASSADEQVSVPSGITGALLFCMSQLDALDIMTQNGVTCRLEDKDGSRIDPATLGGRLNYTVIPPPSTSTFNLLTIIDSPERTYDMTLAVKGFTKEEANAALNSSKLKVDLISLTSGKIIASETHVVREVTHDKKPTTWVETPTASGSLFLDTATGDYWTADTQRLYTFREAVTYCNSLPPVRDFIWQVPFLPALITGRVHGIGTTALGVKKMGIRSGVKYWSASIVGVDDPKTPVAADSSLYSAELLTGEISAETQPSGIYNTVRQPVVCVAIPPAPPPTDSGTNP